MKRKKHKKRKVWPIILVVLTVLIVMAAAAVFLFRTRSYKVEGNSYYGERTITTWIENDPLSVNSLYVLYKYNFTDADLPSGVESQYLTERSVDGEGESERKRNGRICRL